MIELAARDALEANPGVSNDAQQVCRSDWPSWRSKPCVKDFSPAQVLGRSTHHAAVVHVGAIMLRKPRAAARRGCAYHHGCGTAALRRVMP